MRISAIILVLSILPVQLIGAEPPKERAYLSMLVDKQLKELSATLSSELLAIPLGEDRVAYIEGFLARIDISEENKAFIVLRLWEQMMFCKNEEERLLHGVTQVDTHPPR